MVIFELFSKYKIIQEKKSGALKFACFQRRVSRIFLFVFCCYYYYSIHFLSRFFFCSFILLMSRDYFSEKINTLFKGHWCNWTVLYKFWFWPFFAHSHYTYWSKWRTAIDSWLLIKVQIWVPHQLQRASGKSVSCLASYQRAAKRLSRLFRVLSGSEDVWRYWFISTFNCFLAGRTWTKADDIHFYIRVIFMKQTHHFAVTICVKSLKNRPCSLTGQVMDIIETKYWP